MFLTGAIEVLGQLIEDGGGASPVKERYYKGKILSLPIQ